jgi:hypothetical protein
LSLSAATSVDEREKYRDWFEYPFTDSLHSSEPEPQATAQMNANLNAIAISISL